jgi:hypothetical protein
MSATIHYLRPFEREKLAKVEQEAEPAHQAEPSKHRHKRPMPGGKGSKWKRKIGGGVVPGEKR